MAQEGTEQGSEADPRGAGSSQADADDLRFTLQGGVRTLRCTVRRPREDGDHGNSEVITRCAAGRGGRVTTGAPRSRRILHRVDASTAVGRVGALD
ncbi:hypothetical protein [Brachybacterium vulturis]|uniref:hypothetical protein n=1 Tax=Brachybacterium vulturis TaxID=2017484 RepID=UPI003734DE1D